MVATSMRRLDRTLGHFLCSAHVLLFTPIYVSPCASLSPPRIFELCQWQQILAHFQEFGFAVVRAMGTDEVGRVNRWIDQSQSACPAAWLGSAPGSQLVPMHAARGLPTTGSISYSLPLLDPAGSELDSFVRLPSTASIVDGILGGEAAYTEFDFRETRDRDGAGQMLFHHDFGAAGASQPDKIRDRKRRRHDYICQIVYLTDVTPSSPAFAVLPHSHCVPCWPDDSGGGGTVATSNDAPGVRIGEWPFREPHEEKQLREALGSRFAPVRVEGEAGTAVLYDVSLFHTRSDPVGAGRGLRRTMHTYFSRQSVSPLIDWGLIPSRLSSDPFFANQCAAQKHFAALGSNIDAMLQDEVALRDKLTGGYSTTESVLSKIRHLATSS